MVAKVLPEIQCVYNRMEALPVLRKSFTFLLRAKHREIALPITQRKLTLHSAL